MSKGRPVKSEIRQNIVEILHFIGNGYGYEIYKIYREIFPKVSMRVIYYHLKKGQVLGEFRVEKIKKEQGDYSWGSEAEKVYYCLDKKAKPIINPRIKEYLDKQKKDNKQKKKSS